MKWCNLFFGNSQIKKINNIILFGGFLKTFFFIIQQKDKFEKDKIY